MVKVFLGNNEIEKNKSITRKTIEVYGMIHAFIFQKMALEYWDKLDEKSKQKPIVHLAKAIQKGFNAIYDTTGNNEETNPLSNNSLEALLFFIDVNNKKYRGHVETDQFSFYRKVLTKEDIDTESLGFVAMHANPYHLQKILQKNSHQNINFRYILSSGADTLIKHHTPPLFKSNNALFEKCDKYTPIMKKIDLIRDEYVRQNSTLYNEREFHMSDIPRSSSYAFRGTTRTIKETMEAGGLFPRALSLCKRNILPKKNQYGRKNYNGMYYPCPKFMINKKEIIKQENSWDIEKHLKLGQVPNDNVFISASTSFDHALGFANSPGATYIFYADGALNLASLPPTHLLGGAGEREILVIEGVDWNNILAIHPSNVLYRGTLLVKKDFEKIDNNNFWKILQLPLGGEDYLDNKKTIMDIANKCMDVFSTTDSTSPMDRCKKIMKIHYNYQPQQYTDECKKILDIEVKSNSKWTTGNILTYTKAMGTDCSNFIGKYAQ